MDEGTSARPPKNPRRARLANRDLNSQEADAELLELDDDDDDGADGGYDGVPEVGMVFKTHQEVSKFYKRYARRVGFGVSVRRSSFTKEGHCLYLELMCCKGGRKRPEPKFRKRTSATTNCQARVRVKLWGDGLLHLELASLDHNHPVSPSMARFLNCYKHLTGFAKKKALREQEENMVAQSEEPFVLDRWKKDFKRLHVMNRPSEDIIANNRVDRYDYLSMRCLQLVEVGVLSDKYQLALKLIREAEKFLLSDTTYDDTRPKIISRINKANKPDKDGVQGVGKIVDVENGDEGRRRRGRPPQGKESQIPQGMSKVGNPAYQFHVVPAVPYLQPHAGVQPGNKPVDGTSPNALPIGSQYGVQMNPQQYIGNQAAMRPSVVYMFPGGYDPQTLGNGSMMPWIYPQMYQAGQQPKDPTVTTGQPGRKRKVTRRRKIGQSVESFSEPSLPPAGVMPSGPAQSGPTPTGPAQPGPTSTGPAQPGPMATGSESLATAAPGPTPSPRAVPPGPVPQTAG
ncbi:uncharacterized protein A4U43_C09F5110 [Asparagus officinalis]|uniref:Protein FAR1-RELATED SEQUENCE n=1 Tax=Asparagus officinalis TaxID=4686 RepID=A0A5P1EA93_ASPOF|nr:uncharacterized protein A4U43_C09F5110 [Asparagus officinalis]